MRNIECMEVCATQWENNTKERLETISDSWKERRKGRTNPQHWPEKSISNPKTAKQESFVLFSKLFKAFGGRGPCLIPQGQEAFDFFLALVGDCDFTGVFGDK